MKVKVRNKNNTFHLGPKVSIHYINQAKPQSFAKGSFFRLPHLLTLIAIIGGLVFGSYVSWSSKLSQADILSTQSGEVLSASTSEPWIKPLKFDQSELKIVADMLPQLIEANRHQPTSEEIIREQQKNQLRAYFEKWKSPFAKDDKTIEAFLDSNNMNLMIAISFVESSMGKKCYYNNCSGIGGYPPNLRKYDSHADWVRDFDELLEKRYKGLPIEKFMGLYVQPGSPNWINGVKQILGELSEEGIK